MSDATIVALPITRLSREEAETLAVEVLTFLVAEKDRLKRFLRVSGLDPATIRAAATTPAFLLGVLDYLASDEWTLTAFAIQMQTHPQTVMAARTALAPEDTDAREERRPVGPLRTKCQKCGTEAVLDRRQVPHVPRRVALIELARCGSCGGSIDGPEMWLDGRGNEVG